MIYLTRLPEKEDRRERSARERLFGWRMLRLALSRKRPETDGVPLRELLSFGPHGKPYLKDGSFYFNLSHSGGLVACAVEDCEVGVDVERKRRFSRRLRERICTPGELALVEGEEEQDEALTRLWTMKESYMKYTGLGMAQGIRATEFVQLGERPRLKSGDGCFFSIELGDTFLSRCTERPLPLETVWLSPELLEQEGIDLF